MFKIVILVCSLPLMLTAQDLISRTQVHMGTLVTITLPRHQSEWIEKGFKRFKELDRALSSFKTDGDIYRLNHEHNISIGSDTYEALRLSRKYFVQTQGYFDISIGAITKKHYRFGTAERIVKASVLDQELLGMQTLLLSPDRAVTPKHITLDLGGMGKGFAVDQVASLYAQHNITSGTIAASGDIYCLSRCEIAVENPFGEGIIARFTTHHPHTAVSTSGNYRRFVHSIEHNHLINPKTKRPQQRIASVTLIATALSNSALDAYATAASVMPTESAIDFLNKFKLAYVIITTQHDQIRSKNLTMFVTPHH